MADKSCGCGWVIGRVVDRQLLLYSEAVPGGGTGKTPIVLTVIPETVSMPIRCTHCGRTVTWNGSADRTGEMLERMLRRPLMDDEREKIYGGANAGL